MNQEADRRPCEEDLAFCGLIGADVSHELRNVLSVIGEYAGLQDDLLALAERGKPLDYAKLRKLCANIAGQVRKGTETMERFSRFVHAADEPTTSFDLAALVENTAALAQRRVALAGGRLEIELPGRAIPLRGNPFTLQRAVFSSIQHILEGAKKEEPIRMKLALEGPAAVLRVSAAAADGQRADPTPQRLSAAVSQWKGSMETTSAGGILSLVLTIPIP